MKSYNDLKVWLLVVILVSLLFALSYLYMSRREVGKEEKVTIHPTKGASLKIIINVRDAMGHYLQVRKWDGKDFKRILGNEESFKKEIVEKFKKIHGSYGISIENCTASINEGEMISVLECDIKGFICRSGNSYTAEFEWLLGPLGLDFLDNKFGESKDSLYWNGTINGTAVSILVKLPPMNKPYAAWGQPNGHCHAHVWWKR